MKFNKQTLNRKLTALVTFLKPWLSIVLVLIILRVTGLLSGISFFAQSALMKTGLMDVDVEKPVAVEKPFNYDFAVQDIAGNKVNMSDFKGKVIFLNLWATWCGPCRAEMPSIQTLYDKVDHDKIAFVMLSLDTEENHHKVVKYIKDKGFTFPVYQPLTSMPNQLRVSTIPTTFVIGTDGKIKLKNTGMADYSSEDFQKFLEEQAAM